MRIVQLVETLETGGLERVAVDLAMAQKKSGDVPMLYCMFTGGPLADEARAAGIPVTEFHKEPGFSFRILFKLARQLRRDAADVLHTHNPAVHHYGAVAARVAGVAAVVNTRHGPAPSSGGVYQERYFRAVMPWTDRVVFVSEDSQRRLAKKLGLASNKSTVIPNGIALEGFLKRPAAPMNAASRVRFGAVGRLVPVKAHSVLIDAFTELSGRLPNAELRIVGGGPLENDLKEQVRKAGMQSRIRVEGLHHDIAGVLRELEIFVMSSTSEGLPLVILEAMAAGLPIVSTRVGGISEVAPEGEVSVLCAPGSASELAEAMYHAATACDLSQMGARAREIAIARFSLDRMVRSYQAVYAEASRTPRST